MNSNVDSKFILVFGKNLKRIRESKSISQDNLSYVSEISKNQVGLIERGKINTSIDTVLKLAIALEVPIDELFNFDYKKKPK